MMLTNNSILHTSTPQKFVKADKVSRREIRSYTIVFGIIDLSRNIFENFRDGCKFQLSNERQFAQRKVYSLAKEKV